MHIAKEVKLTNTHQSMNKNGNNIKSTEHTLRWNNSTDDYTPKIDSTPIRTKVFSNGKIYVDLAAVLLEKPQEQQLDQQ